MPNTMVTVTGEKPQAAWYTLHSGVGALELARKNRMIDTCRRKAADLLRVCRAVMTKAFRGSEQTGLSAVVDYEQTGLYSQVMSSSTGRVPAKSEASARDRLLAAADELFYGEGIHTVGIDRVLAHAGVAKASLYSTFGSK